MHRRASTCSCWCKQRKREMEQSGTLVHEVARAMEEQLREDDQELKVWEQKKKAKDAKRI